MPLPPLLVDRFRRHLGEVRDEVADLRSSAQAGDDPREPMRVSAHKIAGTAAAYGFPELGERARELEDAILAGEPWRSDLFGKVGAFHAALAQAAQSEPG